jgi:hypothetical protein
MAFSRFGIDRHWERLVCMHGIWNRMGGYLLCIHIRSLLKLDRPCCAFLYAVDEKVGDKEEDCIALGLTVGREERIMRIVER